MRGRTIAGVLAVGAVCGGVWLYTHRTPTAGGAEKPVAGGAGARVVPVVAAPVTQRDVAITLDGLGTATAANTVTVRSQVDGRLEKVLFREGQEVRRGDLLAQIDPRLFEIQRHQAEGALARDQATLKNAKLNMERFEDLRKRNLVPQQQVDDQGTLVGQAEGAVAIDRAALENARLNLDYARITSPIDGVTGVRLIDAGNLVHASDQTGIVVLTQLDPIAVIFTLPQDDLPAVSEQLRKGTLDVQAFARDGKTRLGSGHVLLIDNQINQNTATIRIKALFPNPHRALWPNQFVKAQLLLTTLKDVLVVPATAVQRGPEGLFAYVVGQDQTVTAQKIEVERTQGDLSIISKGLAEGDLVVVDGQAQLRPGAKVQARVLGTQPARAEQGSQEGASPKSRKGRPQ